MCLGASSNKCLSTILHRSVASLRSKGVMHATKHTSTGGGLSPVEMHHTHLAGFDFSKKLLCVGNLPATNRETLTHKFTGTSVTCTAHAPAPSALAAPPAPHHSYKHFQRKEKIIRTCFCFIAIKRRSRSSSSSSRPLQTYDTFAADQRSRRSHVVELLNLLVQAIILLVCSLKIKRLDDIGGLKKCWA
jgi:hypothetical protein